MVQLHFLQWTKKLAKGNISEIWWNSYKLHIFRWNWTHFFLQKNKLRGSHLQHNTRHAKTFVAKSLSSFGQRRDQGKETAMKKTGGRFIKTASYFERKTHTHIQVGEHANFSRRNVYGLGNLRKMALYQAFFMWVLRAEYLTIVFPQRHGVGKKRSQGG